jgi:hypothetical protein
MNEENQERIRMAGLALWAAVKELDAIEKDKMLAREIAEIDADWVHDLWMVTQHGSGFIKKIVKHIPKVTP